MSGDKPGRPAIKSISEGFVVEERAALRLRPRGQHRVYLLKKSHWNTLDLIRFLSRSLSLPLDKFSYGGKKDRHGLTYQFIAIRDQADFSREGKEFVLESRGFMDRPMSPDLITRFFSSLSPIEYAPLSMLPQLVNRAYVALN